MWNVNDEMCIFITKFTENSNLTHFHLSKKQKYLDQFYDRKMFTHPTKMAIKRTKIKLQTSVIPIWNPENQGYKIGYEKSDWVQDKSLKNGSEKKCADLFCQ